MSQDNGASPLATGLSPQVEPASGLDGSATSIPSAWQPINTAPFDKTHVALLRRNGDGSVTYGHGYYMPLEGWLCWQHYAHRPPTHWYPLPDPFASGIEAGTDETPVEAAQPVGQEPGAGTADAQ